MNQINGDRRDHSYNVTQSALEQSSEPNNEMYILSILASLLCCVPCGLIGLMHVMASRIDYSRGSYSLSQKKSQQAKCWTGWACGLGLLFIIITISVTAVTVAKLARIANLPHY
ncbi:hypothetical protein EB796_018384 [Bugula neritina]|uniref:Uncharacterized protein n=1 Tax=Bugula neritina TaxID=10212 RepID=A0A7J7JAP2_BUGNE|nr:hypothetical protein EB796_018384 [Bugula neritina]